MQYPITFLLEYLLVSTECFNGTDEFEFTLFTELFYILQSKILGQCKYWLKCSLTLKIEMDY